MSNESHVETTSLDTSAVRLMGRVKWFNNKAGYGFITDKDNNDIFVHHSGIMVSNQQYKYLIQGEYVDFKLHSTPNNTHTCQAEDVSGINGGQLMCETRNDVKQSRITYKSSTSSEIELPMSSSVPKKTFQKRGAGPRENSEWKLVASKNLEPKATRDETKTYRTRAEPKTPRGRPANV